MLPNVMAQIAISGLYLMFSQSLLYIFCSGCSSKVILLSNIRISISIPRPFDDVEPTPSGPTPTMRCQVCYLVCYWVIQLYYTDLIGRLYYEIQTTEDVYIFCGLYFIGKSAYQVRTVELNQSLIPAQQMKLPDIGMVA